MILVGDVGATKTFLEAGMLRDGRWEPAFARRYSAADYESFDSVLREFLGEAAMHGHRGDKLAKACFGVAGPAFGNRVQMTNIGWAIDGAAIGARFGIPRVRVVNDFAAAASGIEMLRKEDMAVLQSGEPLAGAPRLVIGAGSGLGVAYLAWSGNRYMVIAGEAGHAGFAPATLQQLDLWRAIHATLGRVAAEHVVSGPGLVRIQQFIEDTNADGQAGSRTVLTPAAIAEAGLRGNDVCSRALDLFVACYGDVAGNHALAVMARGGVYLAGGIAPKILPRLQTGEFLSAFNARGAHADAARRIPVSVVLNERLGLLGCAMLAEELIG